MGKPFSCMMFIKIRIFNTSHKRNRISTASHARICANYNCVACAAYERVIGGSYDKIIIVPSYTGKISLVCRKHCALVTIPDGNYWYFPVYLRTMLILIQFFILFKFQSSKWRVIYSLKFLGSTFYSPFNFVKIKKININKKLNLQTFYIIFVNYFDKTVPKFTLNCKDHANQLLHFYFVKSIHFLAIKFQLTPKIGCKL